MIRKAKTNHMDRYKITEITLDIFFIEKAFLY